MNLSLELLRNIIMMCQIQGAPAPVPPQQLVGQCWQTNISCVEGLRARGATEGFALATCMKTQGKGND